ncbi:hypothetical protein [Jeotgalibacillus aurantiacus]|uniref:hypothetical protein n=1 Tax=Jeotgalibacillus aurantiacus TaxID=2763266 RepID=UPI001D09B637|nr:hypothetical protein [Jeotgalibacillus aurantiacus]
MYSEMYGSIGSALLTLVIWWGVFFAFQRIVYWYPGKNSWKKDIIVTFFQSLIVLLVLPVLAHFFGR